MTMAHAALVCPMCGLHNAPDAVFCANEACHKALGEFRYVQEEIQARTHWHESLAERVTGFIGKPRFLVFHIVWFVLWVLLNSGLIMAVRQFDSFPFGLLGILVGIEAVLITGFILISQNRQNAHADKRAELDYEVSVRTYRELMALRELLVEQTQRITQLEADVRPNTPSTKEPKKP